MAEFRDRNAAVLRGREVGRDEWKKEAGYHRRSVAETGDDAVQDAIFSDRLKAREWQRQETELAGEVRGHELDDRISEAGEVYSPRLMQQCQLIRQATS